MELFGTTRSRVRRSHALIAPDSFVTSELPGWERTQGIIVIAPRMGARFTQYLALMEPGGTAGPPAAGVERVLYVLEGEVALSLPGAGERPARPGGFAFCPTGTHVAAAGDDAAPGSTSSRSDTSADPALPFPAAFCGNEHDVAGAPFLGDPDAILKVLLPRDPRFDLAVNVFTFQPGDDAPHGRGSCDGARPLDARRTRRLSPGRRLVSGHAGRRHLDGSLLPAMVRGDGQGPRALPLLQRRQSRPDGGPAYDRLRGSRSTSTGSWPSSTGSRA